MTSINVSELINTRPLTRFQIVVAALCFLIVTIDGFDTASIGFIAPAIGAEWGLKPTDMAPLFGAGLFGLMAGAFILVAPIIVFFLLLQRFFISGMTSGAVKG